nr:immunoglobulin light chain junction region [Macaca mulatta]MOX87654.1 immunoglobulin light chain junction region [Macaca mulatta]MOX88570.1 immunoglobulin light chain junction region [Macaca mulatta]MOX88673.1 immunoglobulin light chain junction region [Macaca mulatta]MOX90042.1 immunoglobulin light chain junction region [Macaca mulatta]
CHQGNKHPYSF